MILKLKIYYYKYKYKNDKLNLNNLFYKQEDNKKGANFYFQVRGYLNGVCTSC